MEVAVEVKIKPASALEKKSIKEWLPSTIKTHGLAKSLKPTVSEAFMRRHRVKLAIQFSAYPRLK